MSEADLRSRGIQPGEPLRLTMTLPGSASLGAYQAGAVSALAVVINSLRAGGRQVRLDAIGGSSAGAIVAMLFSHCLLTGRDVGRVLRSAWIDEVDLELLRAGGSDAPLTIDELERRLHGFLADQDEFPYRINEPLDDPVTLQIGLTSLLGFTDEVETPTGQASGLSYVDWAEFELAPGHDPQQLFEPEDASLLETVLTSAAHPAAFRPRQLDRSAARKSYDERNIVNFPDHGRLWYTDGGLVESQPIGRIVAAGRRATSDSGYRLHLVIDPRSSGPSGNEDWNEPDDPQSWIDGVRRAASILPTQALHDDFRRVASTNRRLERLHDLMTDLADRLDLDDDERHRLRSELAELGDLAGKEVVDVDMISPLLVAEDDGTGVNDLLAGDFIGAFGGFLDSAIRRSDFALGWRTTEAWCSNVLAHHGIDDGAIDAAITALDDARPDELDAAALGGDGIDALGFGGRWKLALLAARFGRVLVGEAIPGWRSILGPIGAKVGRS